MILNGLHLDRGLSRLTRYSFSFGPAAPLIRNRRGWNSRNDLNGRYLSGIPSVKLFDGTRIDSSKPFKLFQWLWDTAQADVRRGPLSFLKFGMEILAALTPYITVGILFLAFIVWNGGVVVGDRTAHVSTIHVPQFFYFFSFTFCFAWPYMLPFWKEFLKDVLTHWKISSCILCLMTAIIHANTLVHPYVLADNRHYVFYVWNYFMGRYTFFKYLLIPLHSFSAYAFYRCLSHVRFLSRVAFLACTCVVLVPQLLLEPRYFIVPYILFRVNVRKANLWQISFESMTTLVVNFLQFFIFVNKVFYWEDQEHPQRISW